MRYVRELALLPLAAKPSGNEMLTHSHWPVLFGETPHRDSRCAAALNTPIEILLPKLHLRVLRCMRLLRRGDRCQVLGCRYRLSLRQIQFATRENVNATYVPASFILSSEKRVQARFPLLE
jgi:hypothetical protein